MQGGAWTTRPRRVGLVVGALLVACVGGLAWPSTVHASADDAPRVAVLPAMVEGDVPADVQRDLNKRVKKALRSDSYELVDAEPEGGACKNYECIRNVAKTAGARYVVVPSIATIEHDYGIAVYVYDITGGRGLERKSTCEICSHDEAIEALVTQAQDLHDPLVELVETPYGDREAETSDDEGPATLVVRTLPAGATVVVDGRKVGTTPLDVPVSPGLKDIEITKRGYVKLEKTARAVRGQRTELHYELATSRDNQTKSLRVVGWTFGTLGVAMLAGGIPLLALHEEPPKSRCSGTNIDWTGTCRYRYDTIVPGALLTSFGVAFLVTGISTGLVAFGRRNKKDKEKRKIDELEEDTISVRPIIGPTSAGVRVRF